MFGQMEYADHHKGMYSMIASQKLSSCVIKTCLVLALGVGFSPLATAGKLVVNVAAGGSVFNLGSTHYVVFPPSAFRTDSFHIGGYPLTYDIAAGIGYDLDATSAAYRIGSVLHDVSFSLNAYYGSTSRKGTVLEFGLPVFDNSNYKLQVGSGRLMLDSEWDFYPLWQTIMPFVEVGVGAARNTLSFKNSPVPVVGVSGGYYALPDNSQIQFAYQLGAGLKYEVSEQVILAARYLYANAGMAASSTYDAMSGVNLGKPITMLVQSQSVLFSMNYLIG
jgi:opacity protein-like surface antigen